MRMRDLNLTAYVVARNKLLRIGASASVAVMNRKLLFKAGWAVSLADEKNVMPSGDVVIAPTRA